MPARPIWECFDGSEHEWVIQQQGDSNYVSCEKCYRCLTTGAMLDAYKQIEKEQRNASSNGVQGG